MSATPPPTGRIGPPLGFPSPARAQLLRFGLALVVGALIVMAVGLFRLTRQFPSAGDSPALLIPFVEPVFALALEAGALIALSVAHVGALVGLAGEPLAVRARRTAALFALTCGVLWAAQLVPKGTEHPGRLANELIQTAVGSCSEEG